MKKKCLNCNLINYPHAEICARCESVLIEFSSNNIAGTSFARTILRRAVVCLAVCLFVILGFYLSLIGSSNSLTYDEKKTIENAVSVLREKGFSDEVFLLDYLTVYRGSDNWLNASTRAEEAYAATNFPFEIMTIYEDFFEVTKDDTERAAILLHEAKHLEGKNEKEAYAFVWKNRKKLGWTKETHFDSEVWRSVRKQTKEFSPDLFICDFNDLGDCTE